MLKEMKSGEVIRNNKSILILVLVEHAQRNLISKTTEFVRKS